MQEEIAKLKKDKSELESKQESDRNAKEMKVMRDKLNKIDEGVVLQQMQ